MPARTDHDRRDAQHAARATVAIHMSRYIRRALETAYAHIEEEATRDDLGTVDWTEVGTAAAHRALASYGVGAPAEIIDGDAAPALPAGAARKKTKADS